MNLVILDRDGVINYDSPEHVKSPEEWRPIPGTLEAVARLNRGGYRVVVATNQSGLGRRIFDIEALNRIHEKMHQQLAMVGGGIEAIFFCPHRPDGGCRCRKPRPGMLLDIAQRLHVALDEVPVVGDAERDLQAARAAGARPVLVRTGHGARTLERLRDTTGLAVYDDLAAFADALLAERAARAHPRG